jgi:hypothetical protein
VTIPNYILSNMDKQYTCSEVSCLRHLLELQDAGYRYLFYDVWGIRFGDEHLPLSPEQVLEAHALFQEIVEVWSTYHDYAWLSEIKTTVLPTNELNVWAPEGHEQVIQELDEAEPQVNLTDVDAVQDAIVLPDFRVLH